MAFVLLLNRVFSYLKKESTYNSEEYCNCLMVKMDYIQVWAFLRLQTKSEISMSIQSLPFESLGTGCKLPTQTYFLGSSRNLGEEDCVTSPKNVCVGGKLSSMSP